jgi:type 1 glutamine amidotransferase
MWNFIGWDNVTTYAGEVDRPARSYLVSVAIAFFVVVGIYLLATLTAHQSGVDAGRLNEEGWPILGVLAGGRWLGIALAAGGMASQMGLYSAVLLSVSRVPQAMAGDNLLPAKLCVLHPRFKTPYISILISSCVVSILILCTFADLITMDIMLYGAGLSLEFITLLVLRVREPSRDRPFRIPLGTRGLGLMILLPMSVYFIALSGSIHSSGRAAMPVFVALGMLVSAELIWRLIVWRNPALRTVGKVLLFAGAFCMMGLTSKASSPPRFRALALYENGGHHIAFSKVAREWLDRLAADSGFAVDYIQKPDNISDSLLSTYQLVIQLDYAPYGWPPAAVQAFQHYIEEGRGGWIGMHHASLLGEFDGYPIWEWFHRFMGGIRFKNYIADFADGAVTVEDTAHPCMKGIPGRFIIAREEWYTYDRSPRSNVHVIASVDESTYRPESKIRMGDHPVIWTNDHVAARNLYIFMGHSPELFNNNAYTGLLRNAIFWAAGPYHKSTDHDR